MICGTELVGHHFLEVRGFCEGHCPDHDWEYDSMRRGHFCNACDAEREYEPSDDDVGLASYREPDEPIGIPASMLDGNAMTAHGTVEQRHRWERWVALSESWGYP